MTRSVLLAALCAAAATSRAAAQGTLSTQGFGYPAGGLSTRALSTGGAVGELDPISTLNPAALTTWGRSGLYGQWGPENRSVKANGTEDNSTVIRFPLFVGAWTLSDRWTLGLSFSNLLDRTWGTTTYGYYHTSPTDSVAYTQNFNSGGALTNVRFAVAYRVSNTFRVGVAGHFITGQNVDSIVETFVDPSFATFHQRTTVNVTGTALSAGIAWSPVPVLALGLSGQMGGVMRGRRNDSLVSDARVPARAGATLLYAGVSGVTLAADAEWIQWSEMNGLAQSGILAVDSWDYGIGAEIRVPAAAGVELPLRVGLRRRTLPYQADSQTVKESVISGGLGIPLAGARARLDLGLLFAKRRAPQVGAQESGLVFSIGVLVRP